MTADIWTVAAYGDNIGAAEINIDNAACIHNFSTITHNYDLLLINQNVIHVIADIVDVEYGFPDSSIGSAVRPRCDPRCVAIPTLDDDVPSIRSPFPVKPSLWTLYAQFVLTCTNSKKSLQRLNNREVAKRLSTCEHTVSYWRRRFGRLGLEGLSEMPRAGAPRRISDEQVERVLRITLEESPQAATHWSTRSLAARVGLSRQAVHGEQESRRWPRAKLFAHCINLSILTRNQC